MKFFEKALNTDFVKGISPNENELKMREEEYGHNRMAKKESESNDYLMFYYHIFLFLIIL